MQTAESLDQQISYYTIRLDVFEGPLDLLLHLIQKDEMDICDVSIADITDQYINYINLMEELDLDVASEFLVMGATLLQIKSQSLLPSPKADEKQSKGFKDREQLVRQLLEYKQFKEMTLALNQRAFSRELIHERQVSTELEDQREFHIRATLFDLITAFQQLEDRRQFEFDDDYYEELQEEPITVEEKIEFVERILESGDPVNFTDLFPVHANKAERIVTFLAILELIRLKHITSVQSGHFTEIYLQKRNTDTNNYGSTN